MGPPQRCVVVVVIVTTARILRSRYRNKNEEGCASSMCRMRRGGRRQSRANYVCSSGAAMQCVKCQRNHWSTHKIECKRCAVELRDEALFKDPPAKEDCPICFLPMPLKIISCVTLPDATITSVSIRNFASGK